MVAKTADNNDYIYRVVVCFSNLAAFEQVKQTLKDKNVVPFLKDLHANNKDPDIQKEAAQALAELDEFAKTAVQDDEESDEEKKEEEEEKNVKEELKQQIKSLVDRLESETKEPELERITAELQQILQTKKESHNILWLKNGVAALVQCVAKSDGPATPSQANAIKALAELAKYRKNRVRIGNSQAIPPLVKHLKSNIGNTQVVLSILFILLDITQKETLLESFRQAKPLDPLLSQLNGEEEVQASSLVLIARTVQGNVPCQVAFRSLGGFDAVTRLLLSASAKIKVLSARVIGSACAGQRRMQQAAAKAKAIKNLSALLSSKEDLQVRLAACLSLGQVVQQDQSCQEKLRKQSGAVDGLIDLLALKGATPDPASPENPPLEQQLVWAALNTAGNFVYLYSKGQNAVRAKKGIPTVVELIKPNNAMATLAIKEQATRLLCYICFYNNKNQEVICTPANATTIVENLAIDSKRLQYYSEGLIWSLAQNSKKRRAILVDAGAIGALLALSQSTSEAVAKGAEWTKQALTKK
jgi:uncharacterized protein YjgD (DUF1641 family)